MPSKCPECECDLIYEITLLEENNKKKPVLKVLKEY